MEDLKNMQMNEIPPESEMGGFIFTAQQGLCTRDTILDHIEIANNKVNEVTENINTLENSNNTDSTALHDAKDNLLKWEKFLSQLEDILSDYKNFNKKLVFSNIRALLQKNPDVKIGQIEKDAGIRLGYMSRLEKEGNTSEPSVEFIVTAAKLLNVSIDALINIDVTALSPTEEYLVKFFDKLKNDTLSNKLDWNKEIPEVLNRLEPNACGVVNHPLFNLEEFYEESITEYPNLVDRVIFMSDSFGTNTYINDDCFNLRLKNGTYIYLMDISKATYRSKDSDRFAKEIWTVAPGDGAKLLVSNKRKSTLSPMIDILFETVKSNSNHPKINRTVMKSIDAFMNDDLSDDEDSLPF